VLAAACQARRTYRFGRNLALHSLPLMLPRFVAFALLAVLTGGAAASLPAPVEEAIHAITAAELERHVAVLASDELAGRGLGHPGNREAGEYIANSLRDAKVPPAAPGYFQPVEVYQPVLGSDSRLAITGTAAPLADFAVGSEFYPLPVSGDRPVTGPLVFGGHGISAPEFGHDDYTKLSARGAVVLVLDGAPDAMKRIPALSAQQKIEIGTIDRKTADARKHGAIGLIVVQGYLADARGVWPDRPSVRSASYRLLAPMRAAPLAVAAISERAAGPVRQALGNRQRLTASLTPGLIAEPVVMSNVLGVIEGRLAGDAMVVIGAHFDHDGIDESGRIYNGADDNASGTSAVLAMASAFARAAAQGVRPARAMVFALWNGEEKGSLGAEHFVTSPVPGRRIIANINLDMIGRREEVPDAEDPRFRGFTRTTAVQNSNVVHLLGYTYSPDLARIVQRANETIRLTIKADYDLDAQGLLRRSDNWPFLQRGVPAVFLTTGLHPDYHTPADDTDRLDFAKLERITELASRVAWMTADGDAPRFKGK
jgi:hypothetical protein